MARKAKRRRPVTKFKPISTNCFFCKGNLEPDYKNYSDLARFVTDRAKIMPKGRTGLCAKHQRRLGAAIKKARYLALLPYSGSL